MVEVAKKGDTELAEGGFELSPGAPCVGRSGSGSSGGGTGGIGNGSEGEDNGGVGVSGDVESSGVVSGTGRDRAGAGGACGVTFADMGVDGSTSSHSSSPRVICATPQTSPGDRAAAKPSQPPTSSPPEMLSPTRRLPTPPALEADSNANSHLTLEA